MLSAPRGAVNPDGQGTRATAPTRSGLTSTASTAAEVGPEDLEQRLRAQAAAADAVLVNPLLVGAVARVP